MSVAHIATGLAGIADPGTFAVRVGSCSQDRKRNGTIAVGKIINLFNHKGGVSKTTTVFNLAWMLGTMGKKVIVADFDAQCNLTGMVLGYKGIEDLEGTYMESPPNNVKDALSPAFESKAAPHHWGGVHRGSRERQHVLVAGAHRACRI